MLSNILNQSGRPASLALNKVGENHYRRDSTETHYALIKRAGKQFRRPLKTTDGKLPGIAWANHARNREPLLR